MTGLIAVGAVFVAIFGSMAVLAARRPLLARLAAREAVRRRGQTLLVIGGLMIGAAGITAALVGADSAEDSAVLNAYRTWGAVDLTVTSNGGEFAPEVVRRLAADPKLAPLVDAVQGALELVGSVSDLTRRQGEPAVRLLGFDPSAQRAFGPFTLTDGVTTFGADLGPGEVLLSRQLATELQAETGDSLTVSVERSGVTSQADIPITVAGIARAVGPGAYGLRAAVFAPLATAQRIASTDTINVIRVSANGGTAGGLEGARRALPALRRAVAVHLGRGFFQVREVKDREIDSALSGTQFARSMLVGMSALIVAAGAALVVNLILMLAEERRPRLAVLRALGLTRRSLVVLSTLEGALYSVAAALVGTALGLVAGRIVAARFATAFAQFFGGQADFRFVFSVHWETVATAFGAGSLVTLLTVALAARRTSRMTIAAAIRDLPEPASPPRRRWPRRVAFGLAVVGGMAGLLGGDKTGRLVGGIAILVALSGLLRGRMSTRVLVSLTGLALAAWSFVMVGTVSTESDPNVFFTVFTMAVMASVFGLSFLAAANLRIVESLAGLLGRLSRGLRTTLRPPLAYLARRPMRTGLATGVFAVVLAIVTLFAVFLSIFRPRVERDSAGYEVRITSTATRSVTLPQDLAGEAARQAAVPTLGYVGPLETTFSDSESTFLPLFDFSGRLLSSPPVRLSARDERYDTDAEVWRAVAADPRLVVTVFGNPGDPITLQGRSGPVRFRVAGNQQFGILDGVIASERALRPFAGASRGVTLLVDTRAGVDPPAFAHRVERELFADGVDATTTRRLLEEGYRASRSFFSVIDVLMRMGLVVGILSLGILALRAIVERRRVIGVLRAIGYRRRGVMGGLMAEAGVTATIGVLVGVVAGLGMGYVFFRQFAPDTGFGLDGASLGTALLLVYGAVLVVTTGPAYRASRLPPAEAVRYTE